MNVKKYLSFIDDHSYETMADVEDVLRKLDQKLARTSLTALRNFNMTYLIITQNVKAKLESGHFEHPEFLHNFDTVFVGYYLRALQHYVRSEPVAATWQITFDRCQKSDASPLMAMALGVNAHVNNDIPQVLLDCDAQPKHFSDYMKVNRIIQNSIDKTINSLDSSATVLNPQRKLLRWPSKLFMNILLRLWRRNAWRKYQKIIDQKLNIARLEQGSARTAQYLLRLPI